MIGACTIVHDAEETLEQCLISIRPFVGEINVWENGSTDGTIEILEGLAADEGAPIRVESGEWRDHFGWAYEQSFAMASPETDWLLWLDQDDELRGGEHLAAALAAAPDDVDGFELEYHYRTDSFGPFGWWRPSLLRRSVGWHWPGAIHELPERKDGLEPNFEPLVGTTFLHLRQDEAPLERNAGLLHRRIEKAERCGQTPLFDDLGFLGMEYCQDGQLGEAVCWLQRALQVREWSKNGLYFAKILAVALQGLGLPAEAVAVGQDVIARYPDWQESPHGLVAVAAAAGDWETLATLERDFSERIPGHNLD